MGPFLKRTFSKRLMNENLSGKKRPRPESDLNTNDFHRNKLTSIRCEEDSEYCCRHCEKCQHTFQEVAVLKQQLNDKIYELNKLIESINYRFNDKGDLMSYIS